MKTFVKKNDGFTMIELIIAIFILAVGILAVLTMFPLGLQVVQSSKMTTIATQLGQEKIEEVISKSYINISSEPKQQLPSPFGMYSRETEATCFDTNKDISPDCPDTGIKKIKVTVSWELPLKVVKKSIEIITLISEK